MVNSDSVTLQASPKLEAAQAELIKNQSMTAAVVGSIEKKVNSNSSRILHNTQLLNVNNYRISGIPYTAGENAFVATKSFFKDIMNITVNPGDLIVASRLPGTLVVHIDGNRVQLPPQMFVKVMPHLQRRIASNIGVLDDKKDPVDGHYYKVKQKLPDATLGAHVHYNKVVQEVQDRNKDRPEGAPRETWYFQGTSLYVNGRRVRDPINPPLWSSLLTISPEHQKVLNNIDLKEQAYQESDGSCFYGYAIRVFELQTIEKVYTRLRQQHVAADHVVLGYRINHLDSPQECMEGSCHDGESQGDVTLAQVLAETRMSNVAVFVVRYSGANPL